MYALTFLLAYRDVTPSPLPLPNPEGALRLNRVPIPLSKGTSQLEGLTLHWAVSDVGCEGLTSEGGGRRVGKVTDCKEGKYI